MTNLKQITFTIILLRMLGCSKTDEPKTDENERDDSQPTATEKVKYQLTFNAVWSAATHPTEFPSGPHFSGLIGMTHNGDIELFKSKHSASPGIKNMAETGGKSPLSSEIDAFIAEKKAKLLIDGGGIGRSPGSVELEFVIEKSHPLVSVVSMIAPSPDWFISVSNFPLYQNDKWVEDKIIPVDVYDAGTDAGISFSSPNKSENKKIQKIITPPLAVDGVVKTMGTITFKRIN